MKVLIATPTFDGNVSIEYLLSLLKTREKLEFDLALIPGIHFVDQARDIAAAKFLQSDCDYLFFIDADLSWPDDVISRIISHNKPVCGGAYRIKHDEELYPNYGTTGSGLQQVSVLPGGFMCIRRDVVQSLWDATPHYKVAYGNKFIEVAAMFSRELHDGVMVSEDVMFCRRASGFGIWLDPDIDFGHTGSKTYYGNYHDFMLRNNNVNTNDS